MTIDSLISVIIPARNERFLQKTIEDILAKAKGNIEIIAVLDGYWIPSEETVEDERVNYLHYGASRGMRNAINKAAEIAKGELLLKCDGHCMFDEGFDIKLKKDIPTYERKLAEIYPENPNISDNWIVIPRRKRLDADNWCVQDVGKPDVDYECLASPNDDGVKGKIWTERAVKRFNKPEYNVDENLSFQGSCWFMTKNHYLNRLGGMDGTHYGQFVREAQEIGLKTWLSGGAVFINKNTWYAHLHKGKIHKRGYFLNSRSMQIGFDYCDDFWFNNRWDGAQHDLAWLIERFMPVPDWTPELIEKVRKK